MKHAEYLIKEKIKLLAIENSDNFETIIVNLEPKNAEMLKAMERQFNFSGSTSFVEIMSKHIFDMIVSLDDIDFKEFKENIKYYGEDESVTRSNSDNHAMGILVEKKVINQLCEFDFIYE